MGRVHTSGWDAAQSMLCPLRWKETGEPIARGDPRQHEESVKNPNPRSGLELGCIRSEYARSLYPILHWDNWCTNAEA